MENTGCITKSQVTQSRANRRAFVNQALFDGINEGEYIVPKSMLVKPKNVKDIIRDALKSDVVEDIEHEVIED